MHILVTYDVSTETAAGRKRLRKIAEACQDFGQRVQKSVFECVVNEMQHEELIRRLVKLMHAKEDSLRCYRLMHPREQYTKVYGIDTAVDFEGPLML
ncbi:MAG: CRISPR-associated endonuclease Cas2 [Nitrospira sp.]|nr:CRISPR-associated endonuclease Cas2 [Nitrospira sp.]